MPSLRSSAAAGLAGLLLALAPGSAAARTCDVRRDAGSFGVTYVTSLKVSGTSCARGKQVIRAFTACRKAHGGVKGRCNRRVLGYRCRERRSSIATQFSSRVTCRAGARRVIFTYTQNT